MVLNNGTFRKYLALVAVALWVTPVVSFASPKTLNFQGRIMKSNGQALEYSSVSFIFQITNPTGSCVIYEEQLDGFDMTGSGGVFDVPIGQATVKFPMGGSFSVLDSFNNNTTFSCKGGATYTTSEGDLRKLRVQFYDGIGWRTIAPDSVIRSVPYSAFAFSSQKLGTHSAEEFVLRTGIPSCVPNTFLSWDGTALTCAPVSGANGGTVTSVAKGAGLVAGPAITNTGTIAVDVGTGPNQIVQLDGIGKLPAVDGSALTGLTPANLGTGPLPVGNLPAFSGDVSSSAGSSVLTINTGAVNSAKIQDGTIGFADLNFGIMPVNSGIVVSNGTTFSNKTCAVGETLIWDVAAGWKCGTFSANETDPKVGANNTNYVSKWSGTQLVAGSIFDDGTNTGIGTAVPTTKLHIAGTSGATLRIVDGNQGTGKFLMSDANGVASWTSFSPVTAVTATAPVVSSGGTTPNISMAAASGSNDGYLTAANFTAFNNKSPAAGSTNITTLGTITTGVWNGSIIPVQFGGTGTSNGSITGTGALTYAAGGTNQNITLNPSGSGVVVLNGSGVGIGTASPSYKLHVAGDIRSDGWLRSAGNTGWYNDTWGGGWHMSDATWIRSYGSKSVYVDQMIGANAGLIAGYGGTVPPSGGAIIAGNVGIGNTSPGQKLEVSGNARVSGEFISTNPNQARFISGNYGVIFRNDGGNFYLLPTNAGDQYGTWNSLRPFSFNVASGDVSMGGGVMTIQHGGSVGIGTGSPSERLEVNGTVKATSFISTSDRRLKKNIETVPGLESVLKLRGVKFNWRSDDKVEYGTIAQEVEEVLPDLVVTDKKSGMKGVKYIGLIAPLIEATKELNNKCDMSADQNRALAVAVENMKADVAEVKRQLASVVEENTLLKEQLKAMSNRLEKLEEKK